MESPATEFVPAASTLEIPPGRSKIVVVKGHVIAIFNVEGSFYATSNTCLHRGGPLGEGFLDDAIVTCPQHGWQYDVRSGENLLNPLARVTTYPVKVDGGRLLVGVP